MQPHSLHRRSAKIVYYFWILSDWAYLGGPRLESLSQRHDIEIEYVPLNLPEVYARTGGVLLSQRAPERQRYRITELERWRSRLGMTCNIEPKFVDSEDAALASCCVIAAMRECDNAGLLANAFMKALWAEEQDICDASTVGNIAEANGFDSDRLIARAQGDDIKEQFRSNTFRAIEDGVFGSPSYVFEGELFWGQDRIEMLEEAVIARKAQEAGALGRG
ncbi:2-hydroxychromene-2-carboxylate isomerase [Mesorhizobium soli]|uniref:2-hydroxychromene-2-carboxylate isomerase n=1 Tax=Pseudaminobacter soli (ex Li et al. 2025) TaxID=1295366 RepID=UPI00247601CC|nr:2-hydroxychromene-2-carboxylate isomerase [Mesorhizobium soli]MDH6233789.1 2-hydroxychromene-2-carboxylate isomerase [Mesorhizobium soli]